MFDHWMTYSCGCTGGWKVGIARYDESGEDCDLDLSDDVLYTGKRAADAALLQLDAMCVLLNTNRKT